MKKAIILTLALAITGSLALPMSAFAVGEGRIFNRMERQQSRIVQGIRSGELTRNEADRLRDEQRRIRASVFHARNNDGFINGREFARIDNQQDRADFNINRLKNNHRDVY